MTQDLRVDRSEVLVGLGYVRFVRTCKSGERKTGHDSSNRLSPSILSSCWESTADDGVDGTSVGGYLRTMHGCVDR
jgi:hypothetical protein